MKDTPSFKLASRQHNKVLSHYQHQLHQQQVLLGILRSALPDTLKEQANYCVIKQNKAFIYTYSAAWASQLRFYTSAMLEAAEKRSGHTRLDSIQIRLLTLTPISNPNPRKPRTPSASTTQFIRETRRFQQDVLSEALTALSNTLDKRRQKP